ncbi:MAG TPA: TIGR02099 family protein, partial [Pseudomonadaceae bacterium]|nr:TIGR02099 family protein [Pseudomonadaceae bacterium]
GQPAFRMIELSGLDLALQESATGEWGIPGLPAGDGRARELLLDFLMETPTVTLDDSHVSLLFKDGGSLQLHALQFSIANDRLTRLHRGNLQFRPALDVEPVRMRALVEGDPRSTFTGQAWLELNGFPLHLALEEFLPATWQVASATTSATLWSRFGNQGIGSLRGELRSLNVSATQQLPDRPAWTLAISNAALQFRALREEAAPDEASPAWLLDVRDLAVDLQNAPVDIGSLHLRLPLEESAAWRLQLPAVEFAALVPAIQGLPLPGAVQEALQTLDPAGAIENLVLESDRAGEYPGVFDLRANFHDLALDAWKGAPAGRGLAGYVQLDAGGGMVELDSRDARLYLPGLFPEPWYYRDLNARVSWELSEAGFRVASSPIHLRSDMLQGVVQFGLDTTQPGWQSNYPELSLLVGMDRMDVAIHSAYLPRLSRIANTMDWLDAALQTGSISNSMFMLRTPTGGDPGPASSTHAGWFEAADAPLRFLEDWPELAVDSAWVKVQDRSVQVGSAGASISGIEAHRVDAGIEPLEAGGSLLTLQIDAAASTELGIRFLRESPIRNSIGSLLDDWAATGALDLQVGLAIPLGTDELSQSVEVRVVSDNSSLYLQDQHLAISAIDGEVRYDSSRGLNADSLTARLFDADAVVAISSDSSGTDTGRMISVSSVGQASVSALRDWEGQPSFVRRLLAHADGELDYTATLDLPALSASGSVPRLRLQSNLLGMESRFPPPFAKAPEAAAALQLDLEFGSEQPRLQLRYSDWLSGALTLDAGGIDHGNIHVGPLNQNFTIRQTDAQEPGLLLNGKLEEFDYDAWRLVGASLVEEDASGKGFSDYLRLIDVDVGELLVAGQTFSDINVQVQHRGAGWQIQGRNDLLAGTLQVPDDPAQAWQVDLEYLRLPAREVVEPELAALAEAPPDLLDPLDNVDPASLPAFDFGAAELAIGKNQLGSWRFSLRPEAQGASIRGLSMQEASSSITGLPPQNNEEPEAEPGATIEWRYENQQHSSRFEGVFAATDLARVAPLWGHNANVISRSADFRGNLQWPGSPLAFSFREANGNVQLHIQNGRFVDVNSGSSRLLGAFNFDNLVRRLELDFSDLYQRGFTFDNIRGELDFINGVLHTRNPLVIDGPSSRLAITGEVDLARETISADMLVRIPLSENISLLAGLLGAWPIAVSTYIASKIFAEQVADFTTIIYRLEGPWSNPQAGFEAPEDPATP